MPYTVRLVSWPIESGMELSSLTPRSSLSKRVMRIEIKSQIEGRTRSSSSAGLYSPVRSSARCRWDRAYQRDWEGWEKREREESRQKSSLWARPGLFWLQGRLQILPIRLPSAMAPVQPRHGLRERSAKEEKNGVSEPSQTATISSLPNQTLRSPTAPLLA